MCDRDLGEYAIKMVDKKMVQDRRWEVRATGLSESEKPGKKGSSRYGRGSLLLESTCAGFHFFQVFDQSPPILASLCVDAILPNIQGLKP